MKTKRHYTTGELSRIFGCAPRTVSKWADRGILPCHRIPLSLDRRFARDDVIRFAREHGVPMEGLLNDRCAVVASGDEQLLFAIDDVMDTHQALDLFLLGLEVSSRAPIVIVLDTVWSLAVTLRLIDAIRAERPETIVAAIAPEDDATAQVRLAAAGAQLVQRAPCDPVELAAAIAQLIRPRYTQRGSTRVTSEPHAHARA